MQGTRICVLALTLAACSADHVTAPTIADVDRIELHAWKDALGPAYPLTITSSDSIASIIRFFDPSAAAWRDTTAFPGVPILAAFYADSSLLAEYGFVEISHGQGGYLVSRTGSRIRVRIASANDIDTFLAYFGLSVRLE
jgi:hypothetical protein